MKKYTSKKNDSKNVRKSGSVTKTTTSRRPPHKPPKKGSGDK